MSSKRKLTTLTYADKLKAIEAVKNGLKRKEVAAPISKSVGEEVKMGFLEERDFSGVPTIPEYFIGKTIFITGGSGFIGKVLVEKLLYSCGELDRIYLLLRAKKGVHSEDRLEPIYSLPCFDRLRKEKPNVFKQKVFVINGDVSEPGLGLSEEDRTLLINRVNVVFHVAASVRFDDPLTFAAKLNLRGTTEMVELAKEIKDLSSFVHVSTSYSNTNRDPVCEEMYPPHADWKDTLRVCDQVEEHTIRMLTPKYLGEIPNTYTFTKQLAEHVVYEQRGQLPAVIIRPSIVIAALEEPVPGWVENFNGPVGIFVACGKGIMRSIHTKPDIVSDYIPVDVCVKHIIAAAWVRGTKKIERTDDVEIYNCCSGKLHSIVMKDLIKLSQTVGASVPLDNALWTIGGHVTTNGTLHYIKVLIQHLLPAVIVDMILWLLGNKPMLVKVQRRIYTANLALHYYLSQHWSFDNRNFIALRSALKAQDLTAFYYEVENVDIAGYFKNCFLAGRRYLLKEKDEDLPKAKAHSRRLVVLEKVMYALFYGCIVWLLWKLLVQFYGDVIYQAFIL